MIVCFLLKGNESIEGVRIWGCTGLVSHIWWCEYLKSSNSKCHSHKSTQIHVWQTAPVWTTHYQQDQRCIPNCTARMKDPSLGSRVLVGDEIERVVRNAAQLVYCRPQMRGMLTNPRAQSQVWQKHHSVVPVIVPSAEVDGEALSCVSILHEFMLGVLVCMV